MLTVREELYSMITNLLKENVENYENEKNTIVIDDETNLFEDINLDSICIMQLLGCIEQNWGISLSTNPELIDAIEYFGTLVDFVEKRKEIV